METFSLPLTENWNDATVINAIEGPRYCRAIFSTAGNVRDVECVINGLNSEVRLADSPRFWRLQLPNGATTSKRWKPGFHVMYEQYIFLEKFSLVRFVLFVYWCYGQLAWLDWTAIIYLFTNFQRNYNHLLCYLRD